MKVIAGLLCAFGVRFSFVVASLIYVATPTWSADADFIRNQLPQKVASAVEKEEFDQAIQMIEDALKGFTPKDDDEKALNVSVLNAVAELRTYSGDVEGSADAMVRAFMVAKTMDSIGFDDLTKVFQKCESLLYRIQDIGRTRNLSAIYLDTIKEKSKKSLEGYQTLSLIRGQLRAVDHCLDLRMLSDAKTLLSASNKLIQEMVEADQNNAVIIEIVGYDYNNLLTRLSLYSGDMKRALELAEASIGIAEKGPWESNQAATLITMAEVHRAAQDWDKALELLIKASELYKFNLNTFGPNVMVKEQFTPTELEGLRDVAQLTASVLMESKQYGAAITFFDKAIEYSRRLSGANVEAELESILGWGRAELQLKHVEQAKEIFEIARIPLHKRSMRTLFALGDADQVFQLEQVRLALNDACRLSLLDTSNPDSAQWSFEWSINFKGLPAQSQVRRNRLSLSTDDSKVKKLRQVRSQLASFAFAPPSTLEDPSVAERIKALEKEEDSLIGYTSVQADYLHVSDKWRTVDDLRSVLTDGEALVDYFCMDGDTPDSKKYVAWCLRKDLQPSIAMYTIGAASDIDPVIAKLNEEIALSSDRNPNAIEHRKQAAALAEKLKVTLLDPMRSQLRQLKQISICPDGPLWLIPWSALPVSKDKLLVEHANIRLLSASRSLLRANPKISEKEGFILADPDFNLRAEQQSSPSSDSDSLRSAGKPNSLNELPTVKRLPATLVEAKQIMPSITEYTSIKPTLVAGTAATVDSLLTVERPRVLVLCTHAFFLPVQSAGNDYGTSRTVVSKESKSQLIQNPFVRCGVLLAGCNTRNDSSDQRRPGVLTGLEISGINLSGTELVVLSGCETGTGSVVAGDGVKGLRQAFQIAGAQSVLGSLWEVPDRETAILMSDFFDNLRKGESKPTALRNAQIKMIKSSRGIYNDAKPYNWAAWTITE